uniref:Uncharacterized protein n=1 Tax=Nelumbo nucifera TaxID=4432 RepID=A0A822ZUK3_NELNU|nr:TPA_asm: hypothetical protein HUJ06_016483 [Nelumbo nucifera]
MLADVVPVQVRVSGRHSICAAPAANTAAATPAHAPKLKSLVLERLSASVVKVAPVSHVLPDNCRDTRGDEFLLIPSTK